MKGKTQVNDSFFCASSAVRVPSNPASLRLGTATSFWDEPDFKGHSSDLGGRDYGPLFAVTQHLNLRRSNGLRYFVHSLLAQSPVAVDTYPVSYAYILCDEKLNEINNS